MLSVGAFLPLLAMFLKANIIYAFVRPCKYRLCPQKADVCDGGGFCGLDELNKGFVLGAKAHCNNTSTLHCSVALKVPFLTAFGSFIQILFMELVNGLTVHRYHVK